MYDWFNNNFVFDCGINGFNITIMPIDDSNRTNKRSHYFHTSDITPMEKIMIGYGYECEKLKRGNYARHHDIIRCYKKEVMLIPVFYS